MAPVSKVPKPSGFGDEDGMGECDGELERVGCEELSSDGTSRRSCCVSAGEIGEAGFGEESWTSSGVAGRLGSLVESKLGVFTS